VCSLPARLSRTGLAKGGSSLEYCGRKNTFFALKIPKERSRHAEWHRSNCRLTPPMGPNHTQNTLNHGGLVPEQQTFLSLEQAQRSATQAQPT
jgi:hypothetical protein